MSAGGADELVALRSAYQAGTVTRDELWRRSQEANARVVQVAALLADGDVTELRLGSPRSVARLRSGLTFEWDPADLRSPPNMALIHGSYEPEERRLLEALAATARTIFDVGANVGWYAVHLAAAAGKDARLHAFEPVRDTYATLVRNVALNGVQAKVACQPFGLGERNERVKFFVPQVVGSVAASRVALFADQPNREIECEIRTLDDWAAVNAIGPADLIKVDIEGSELLFFRGARKTLGASVPVIFCEMLRKWSAKFDYHPNDIIAELRAFGYECWEVAAHSVARITAVTDQTLATNFLFLHPERHAAIPSRLGAAR